MNKQEKRLVDYINKRGSPQKEICQELRQILLIACHGVKEEIKWGAMVYGDGKFYIGVVKYGVNLGFAVKGLNKKEVGLFEGSGKTRVINSCKMAPDN
jgi:hypothetical protein